MINTELEPQRQHVQSSLVDATANDIDNNNDGNNDDDSPALPTEQQQQADKEMEIQDRDEILETQPRNSITICCWDWKWIAPHCLRRRSENNEQQQPLTRSQRWLQYLRICMQYALLLFTLFMVILWIGTEVQERRATAAPDTLYLYNTSTVCGMVIHNETNSSASAFLEIAAYPTKEDVEAEQQQEYIDHALVAHCGDCGHCSNPHDMNIFDQTKNTLYATAVQCSQVAFFRGSLGANQCMDENVGLTPACRHCWVANIMCDIRNCLFVCFWHAMFSKTQAGDEGTQALNRCTYCDEKRCGTRFVQCAGANRRRSGILSDIERNQELEVCQDMQPTWWLDDNIQAIWDDMGKDDDQKKQEGTL